MTLAGGGSRGAQARWRSVSFEALPDGAVVVDASGRVADLNRLAAELLGRPAERCRGRRLATLLPTPPPSPENGVEWRAELGGRQVTLRWQPLGEAAEGGCLLLIRPLEPLQGSGKRANLLAQILSVANFLRLHAGAQDVLQEIVNAARTALGFDAVVLNLLDRHTGVFDLHVFAGLTPEGQEVLAHAAYTRVTMAPLMQERFRKGHCYFIPAGAIDWEQDFAGPTYNPLANDPNWVKAAADDAWDPQDALFVPIEPRPGEIVGLLWVDAPVDGRRPDEETLHALEIFANQAAVAIENERLFSEVQRLTVVDELTQLYNRRGLFQIGVRELERTRRFGRPLSAFFLDIDHFRDFNNRYSHAVGDEVLRAVAARLRGSLRSIDVTARYGGEEFVALLVETPLEPALGVAEELRSGIEAMRVATTRGELSVTVSVGVAAFSPGMPDLAALLDLANQAEHLAKEGGRNRVAPLR